MGVLVEQEVLVVGAGQSPHHHRYACERTHASSSPVALEVEQNQPQSAVFGALNEGDRHSLSHLSGVVKSDPRGGLVSATGHHELGTEHPPERPARHEGGEEGVGERPEGHLGPPVSNPPDSHGQRDTDGPETREPTLPGGDPSSGVARVVGPVSGDIGAATPEESGDEQGCREPSEGLLGDAGFSQAPARVKVGDVAGNRQAESVEVKGERTQVNCGGNARHVYALTRPTPTKP